MLQRLRDPMALVAVGLIVLAAYGLARAGDVTSTTLLVLVVVIPSIILHELAHGVAALACGDDTAKRAGRITLNPLPHIDPLGTIVLPGLLSLSGLGAFGYAKPVPISPSRMRSPRNHALIVSLAGPATNLALAGISILAIRYARPAGTAQIISDVVVGQQSLHALGTVDQLLFLLGFLNVTLAVFNLIPLPPLDGSAVIERLLPTSAWPTWQQVRRYAMPVLLVLVLLHPDNFLQRLFDPAERAWARVLAS